MDTPHSQANKLKLITQQLKASESWQSKNSDSMKYQRVEGLLPTAEFQAQMLDSLAPYQTQLGKLTTGFVCGFEIEFFLQPEKINRLQERIADILPDYQMLLISLDSTPTTNHRNFYLIQENTGQPPEGLTSYEIVSPILDYKSVPYFLHAIFAILKELDAKDNDSIGFHLHVSTIDDVKISPLALLYFLDELGILDNKARQYTRDIIQEFFSYSAQDWQWIFEEVTRKCYNVNLLHYPNNNHIELRSMGGAGFLNDQNSITTRCLNCLYAYEQAIHHNYEKVAKKILSKYEMQNQVVQTKNLKPDELTNHLKKAVWFV